MLFPRNSSYTLKLFIRDMCILWRPGGTCFLRFYYFFFCVIFIRRVKYSERTVRRQAAGPTDRSSPFREAIDVRSDNGRCPITARRRRTCTASGAQGRRMIMVPATWCAAAAEALL